MSSAAPATERRAIPALARVEFCYAIFTIREDRSFMTRFEQWTFDRLFMPLARWGFNKLHWPIFERLDELKCERCAHVNKVENGGRWTEKETVVTTRALAVQLCREPGSYFHRLRVNDTKLDPTLRERPDHCFPNSNGAKQYAGSSIDVDEVNRNTVDLAYIRGTELLERLSAISNR